MKPDTHNSEAKFRLFDFLRLIALLGQPGGLLASSFGLGLEAGLDFRHPEVDEEGWEVCGLGLAAQPHGLREVGHSLSIKWLKLEIQFMFKICRKDLFIRSLYLSGISK